MRLEIAQALMDEFAKATGLLGNLSPRRYLWTDAYAVDNFLCLHRATGSDQYLQTAIELVNQVHHILGRHRADDRRTGWLSGLADDEGAQHPTCGGLRIGKRLPERTPEAPFDDRLEWDRDGQYFHYLTKWMQALHCVSRATGEPRYLKWALLTYHALGEQIEDYWLTPLHRNTSAWKDHADINAVMLATSLLQPIRCAA
jgi:hypothetical protein